MLKKKQKQEQFDNACKDGNLELAQQLLRDNPDFDIDKSYHGTPPPFILACWKGQLAVAKWLLEVKPDINISYSHELAFCTACMHGRLEVAQWLLQVKPDIKILAVNGCAFTWSCVWGYLNVAQWLFQIKPYVIQAPFINTNEIFRLTCKNGHLHVAQWFAEDIMPKRYEITEVTTDKNGKHKIQYKIYENNDRPIMDYTLK